MSPNGDTEVIMSVLVLSPSCLHEQSSFLKNTCTGGDAKAML